MRAQKTLTAFTLACTLLTGTAPAALAQDGKRAERREQTEQQQREFNIIRQERETMVSGQLEPTIIQGVPATPLRGDTFTFVATEMSFDHKVVKGAPYSAEGVTESVQTLADGNRIVRKQSSQIYRDGEGRTRREYTISALGPWGTQEDPPRTVSINDPVAKVSYTLDPRTRTARKFSVAAVSTVRGNATVTALGGGVRALEARAGELRELETKAMSDVKSVPASRVVKSVDAVNTSKSAPHGRGLVAVKIKVNAAGAVESAEAVTGDEALRPAAVEAARQWRFKPGEAETGAISFNFETGKANVPGEVVRILELKKDKDGVKGNHTMILSTVKPHTPPNVQTEKLGKQLVEGVEAEGTRTTRTIPAGEIGNEQPIQIVSERWYSPELQVTVMTRQSDPRVGETIYRLTNIVRAEPAATLFQLPSDYTVKDAEFIRALPTRKPLTTTTPQEN